MSSFQTLRVEESHLHTVNLITLVKATTSLLIQGRALTLILTMELMIIKPRFNTINPNSHIHPN